MIQITADTRRAVVTNKELLTKGSAGIQVRFTLSEDWAGLAKVAVFRQGDDGERVDCVLDSGLTCVVPPEVLTIEDEVVFCGVYGSNGQGTIIIPTIWASLGVVRPGTEPNTPATATPTPEIWAQILNVAQDAEATADEAMSFVEAGLTDLSALEARVETAEASRVLAEQGRVSAENQRVMAENNRVLAENARVAEENERNAAETARAGAERNRTTAENARADAEASRASAEQERVAAEQYREEKYAEYVQTVTDAADDARASATTAANSASTATAAARDASDSAGQAATSASAAATSASQASSSESNASSSASTATGAAAAATTQAGVASTKADEAASSATAAAGSATDAAAAQTAAETAQAAAEDAADSVSASAAQIAQNASDITDLSRQLNDETTGLDTKAPVILETASGAIASFSDGADSMPIKKLVANIEPVQDLHGYDHPWPAGGGVNKCDMALVGPAQASSAYGLTITKDDAAGTITVSGTPNYTSTGRKTFRCYYFPDADTLYYGQFYLVSKSSNVTNVELAAGTNSDNSVTINIDVSDLNAVSIVVKPLLYLQTDTAPTTYAPYSNICPISGWTGAEIEQTGKNLFDATEDGVIADYTYHVSNIVKAENSISFKSTGTWAAVRLYRKLIPGTYTISIGSMVASDSGYIGWSLYDYDTGTSIANILPATFTLTSEKIVEFRLLGSNSTSSDRTVTFSNIQLEYSSTASDYAPYTGNQISVNWEDEAGTVYVGTVTLNQDGSADVISTHCIYDIPSTQWTYHSGATCWYIKRESLNPKWDTSGSTQDNVIRDIVCSAYKTETYNHTTYSSYAPCIAERRYAANWIAVQTGSADVRPVDCQVKMKLATPTTYHFPNVGQLKTFLGTNNVWCDTGDITELDYCADTKLYIDSLTAPDEDMIADSNIASGQYFTVNNKLYLSTAAIAAGASIIPGTNCTETNLAAALNALNT